jgi:ABC-type branched-subunit amino acid transport system substrate-binding protein
VGLSAPFEGRSREVGYQALHAVRLAVRQWNESGGVGDRYFVELVALNDLNIVDEALFQARKMAVDRDVAGVLGGFSPHVARRASVEYARLGLVFLSPARDLTGPFQPVHVDSAFLVEYEALSGGVPPGDAAMWAYEAANRLLAGIDTAVHAKALELRAATRVALESSD